ncbi:WecB/TagA/CpsF family glycosyltransferase, partial [Enterococcus faecalis]|nr:WecB/TagA/CpsF family glycosyltransferase [Enterococcus faecalis]
MKKTLFGIQFDDLTLDQTVMVVKDKIRNKKATHLLGVNADKINDFYSDDERYRRIIEEADIINPDGISVILASKILKKELPERVAGIDLMESLLATAAEEKFSVYFLGAKEAVLKDMIYLMRKKYPNLVICGSRNGYFEESEWETVAKDLKQQNPDIVFVGIT